ncbi:chondroitinase family polysaccharide lyase [Labilibaculum sp.]|uniref:chondroitinase family polysaccharide lyase n=1 Tax=Labilibaculum sp. TaxID=2060723 RepID=UPI002AA95575|nr:chondroitinase family polysaccharide lyase [Labilibaculum sp.]
MRKILIFLSFLYLPYSYVLAQYIGLEGQIPDGWTANAGSDLSISNEHYKLGTQSLKWEWTQGATLTVLNPPNLKNAANTYKGGLMLWIYNEKAIDKELTFQFGKGSQVEYHFDYKINFEGWRACWIQFTEDMSGPKTSKDLEFMKVVAPNDVASGTLFFDRMIFPSTAIHDRRTPDQQLPYINPSMNENHWAALWHWFDKYSHDIPLMPTVNADEQKAFDSIKEEMRKVFQGSPPANSKIESVKTAFRAFDIKRSNGQITGRPYVSDDEYDSGLNDVKMIQVGPVLEDLAQIWHHKKDVEAKQMFYDLLDYVMDQGLNVGSGMGTNHHYGYQFREFPPAVFLMKDALKADGKLDEAVAMLSYWTGIQEYRIKPEVGTLQGLMDSWNTTIIPRLVAVMTMDDTPEKAREMKTIKRWMDISLKIVPGSMGGIKEDGSGFHHGGLYPAYSTGGYAGIGSFLRYVNGTCFALSEEARINFGKGLLAMRNYSNLQDWGFGICGRHPLAGSISSGAKNAFAYLAKSGDPYTKEELWKEMAAGYMRLEVSNTAFKQEFEAKGISAEAEPEGNFTYNYGALGIHRRDNWMVSVKGYNRHVWGSEIYTKDNRYGRYQSYGTVQVIGAGNHVNARESGFVENGWDWNRYPGATSIHLPLTLLESPLSGTLMEKSSEGFTGASNLHGENGVFGMILNEGNRSNFTADHQAYKSVFCFDNRIICLGSGISNSNSQYKTETTLFQVNLKSQSDAIYADGNNSIINFPLLQSLSSDKSHWILDPVGNAYWVKDGVNVQISRSTQDSRENKTKAATKGDFAAAWIDHGTAPDQKSYEYVILPNSDLQAIQDFSNNMNSETTAAYKVLQQDNQAHIVWDRAANTSAYVFFRAIPDLSNEFVKKISAAGLVMIKSNDEKDQLSLSVCDPDLHFPEVAYTSALPSQESIIVLTLNGIWEMDGQNAKVAVLPGNNQQTQLQFTLKDGIPQEINLRKVEALSDITAPTIYQIQVSDIDHSSATIELGSNESGTLFWFLNAASEAVPVVEDVMSGTGALMNGQTACNANELWQGSVTNLQEGETYALHAVAADAAGNVSSVYSSDSFSTLVTGLPDITVDGELVVFGRDGKIVLQSKSLPSRDSSVQIFDLMGRMLISVPYEGSRELSIDAPNQLGTYIVRLQMNGQFRSKKVLIKG